MASVKVYYLQYPSKEDGINDLITRGIIVDSGLTFTGNVQSVVNVNDTIFNVMTTDLIDFGVYTYFPITFEHTYAGWESVMVPVYIMPLGIYQYYSFDD